MIFSSPRTLTVNLDYDMPITSDLAATFHLDVSRFDERWFNTDNTIALPSYRIVNARATLRDGGDRWAVVLWAKNLGDERIVRTTQARHRRGTARWPADTSGTSPWLPPGHRTCRPTTA